MQIHAFKHFRSFESPFDHKKSGNRILYIIFMHWDQFSIDIYIVIV